MKKLLYWSALSVVFGFAVTVGAQPSDETATQEATTKEPEATASAEPSAGAIPATEGKKPDGDEDDKPEKPRREKHRGGARPPGPPNPFLEALDTDKDSQISAEELNTAKESLLKLDTNRDGRLSEEEVRPPGRPPRDRGSDGPPWERRIRSGGSDRPDGPEGEEGRGRRDEFGPPPGGPHEEDLHERGSRGRGRRGDDHGPGPDGPEFSDRGPAGRGPGGERRPMMGPPDPGKMVDHAFRFDADGDGKLDREELMRFAEEVVQRRRRGRDDHHPPDPGGPPPEPQNEAGESAVPEPGENPESAKKESAEP